MQDQLLRIQQEQQRLQTEQQHSSRDSRICQIQWWYVLQNISAMQVSAEQVLLYMPAHVDFVKSCYV